MSRATVNPFDFIDKVLSDNLEKIKNSEYKATTEDVAKIQAFLERCIEHSAKLITENKALQAQLDKKEQNG